MCHTYHHKVHVFLPQFCWPKTNNLPAATQFICNMAESFEACWDEFRKRAFPRYTIFCKFLKENLSLGDTTSMLDIGAGEKELKQKSLSMAVLVLTDSLIIDAFSYKNSKSLEKKQSIANNLNDHKSLQSRCDEY